VPDSYELKCIASATRATAVMVPTLLSLLSGAAAFAPAARRWARSAPRALRGVARAAGDDGLSLRAERLKSLLLDEDFDGAAREGAAALEVLPDLADVARLRGRALLDPLLDKVIGGDAVDAAAFEPAYEAFRLAAVMNPGDSAEARDELARIKELRARLDGDDVETTAEAVGRRVPGVPFETCRGDGDPRRPTRVVGGGPRAPLRRRRARRVQHGPRGRRPGAGRDESATRPTSKAPISAVFHSFRLIFGRAIISRNDIDAWMCFPERARAAHSC